jgi:hypothetical protein
MLFSAASSSSKLINAVLKPLATEAAAGLNEGSFLFKIGRQHQISNLALLRMLETKHEN